MRSSRRLFRACRTPYQRRQYVRDPAVVGVSNTHLWYCLGRVTIYIVHALSREGSNWTWVSPRYMSTFFFFFLYICCSLTSRVTYLKIPCISDHACMSIVEDGYLSCTHIRPASRGARPREIFQSLVVRVYVAIIRGSSCVKHTRWDSICFHALHPWCPFEPAVVSALSISLFLSLSQVLPRAKALAALPLRHTEENDQDTVKSCPLCTYMLLDVYSTGGLDEAPSFSVAGASPAGQFFFCFHVLRPTLEMI